ncbi:hypothetical protein E3P99_00253 [Wallemia hederae]|uniref:Major facilitator superfamily (MFS) profile domain-containing protein n=1 Tax=Wallemia hederae TaxID=1540922 RepID=A0A4V4LUE8_9BASI|nr:hypothetical protein E3P99_00253 [Wallemia hederae]
MQFFRKPSFFNTVTYAGLIANILTLCEPGIGNLGAGGFGSVKAIAVANALVYALMTVGILLSAPIISYIGLKPVLILGCAFFCVCEWKIFIIAVTSDLSSSDGAALYYNSIAHNDGFLIGGSVLCGISAAAFWATEGTIFSSLPANEDRGRYLALWGVAKNLAPLALGGSISLGFNVHSYESGNVDPKVYIVFFSLMAAGFAIAFLFPNPSNIYRRDGTKVEMRQTDGLMTELTRTLKAFREPRVFLLLPLFFMSYFYYAYQSNYTSLYFNVRTRALSSFVSPFGAIISSVLMGFYLDSKRWSEKTKGIVMLAILFVCEMGLWTWIAVLRSIYGTQDAIGLDFDGASFVFNRAFPVVFFMNFVGQGSQNYLYWVVGHYACGVNNLSTYVCILRSAEACGQTVAWAISQRVDVTSPVHIYINFIGLFLSILLAIPVVLKLQYYEKDENEFVNYNVSDQESPRLSVDEKEKEKDSN